MSSDDDPGSTRRGGERKGEDTAPFIHVPELHRPGRPEFGVDVTEAGRDDASDQFSGSVVHHDSTIQIPDRNREIVRVRTARRRSGDCFGSVLEHSVDVPACLSSQKELHKNGQQHHGEGSGAAGEYDDLASKRS